MINQYFNFGMNLSFSFSLHKVQVYDFYYVSCHVSHIVNIRQTHMKWNCVRVGKWKAARNVKIRFNTYVYTLHVALFTLR